MVSTLASPDLAPGRHPFTAPSVSRAGDRTVVWLAGDNDIATQPLLMATLTHATSFDSADVIVDLSGVTFISADTIGAVIRVQNSLRRTSRQLVLRAPSRFAARVLDLCGLTYLVESD
jgi:anti-anti-sigma factor